MVDHSVHTQPRELWGAFSVIDHKRPRAFVAEVLIYDRLVIPTPPPDDQEEYWRWRRNRWKPDRQSELLDILRKENMALEIPWSPDMRARWEAIYHTDEDVSIGEERSSGLTGLEFDIRMAKQADRSDAPFLATGGLLSACVRGDLQVPTIKKLVALSKTACTSFDTVNAYSSFARCTSENQLRKVKPDEAATAADLAYHLFGWEFLVPEDSNMDDRTLLRKTITRLAKRDDLRQARQYFQGYMHQLNEGRVELREATEQMEKLLKEYTRILRRSRFRTVARWAARIIPVVASFTALLDPTKVSSQYAAAGVGVLAAGSPFALEYLLQRPAVPPHVRPAILVHEARRFFRRRWWSL